MFCPQCGQQQISQETRFCSRCGFLLTGVADIVARGGALPDHLLSQEEKPVSPRKRGLKQGLFIFLLTFLVVPIVAIISVSLRIPPFPTAFAAILLSMGGLLRMVYALMFESTYPGGTTMEQQIHGATQNILNRPNAAALPPQQSIPVTDYVSPASGNWRDTNELAAPGSVTDNTTRLLEKTEDQ
jgi:hypothetical protein